MPLVLVAAAVVVGWSRQGDPADRREAVRQTVEAAWATTLEGGDPAKAFGQSDPAVLQALRAAFLAMLETPLDQQPCQIEVIASALAEGQASVVSYQAVLKVGTSTVELALHDPGTGPAQVIGVSVR